MPTPLEDMRIIARRFQSLNLPYAFVGGAIVPVLMDNPALTEFRPTKDVDIVVQVITLVDYYQLEDRLRAMDFAHDTSEGAPICRWKVEGCTVDIMPVEGRFLGLASRWFPEALDNATTKDLGENVFALVITPPFFLATKLAAFADRGKGDFASSHDLEDVITLIDGRAGIIREVAAASPAARDYIAQTILGFLASPDFLDALPGHFPLDPVAGPRRQIVLERLKRLSQLTADNSGITEHEI